MWYDWLDCIYSTKLFFYRENDEEVGVGEVDDRVSKVFFLIIHLYGLPSSSF